MPSCVEGPSIPGVIGIMEASRAAPDGAASGLLLTSHVGAYTPLQVQGFISSELPSFTFIIFGQ
jgi:hypothetical protein